MDCTIDEGAWAQGPADARGMLLDASDRNLLCMAVRQDGNEVCFGSADHAAYCFALDDDGMGRGDGRRADRVLFGRNEGHREWVTAVAYDKRGGTFSGGMDGQLLYWPRASTRCRPLSFHTSSISAILSDSDSALTLSADYAGAIAAWGSGPRPLWSSTACAAPVLCLAYHGATAIAGDRDGAATAVSLESGDVVGSVQAHLGHTTSVAACEDAQTFSTGGQDGVVRIWDARMERAAAQIPAHRGEGGKGAVSDMCWRGASRLVSSGADRKVCVLDARTWQVSVELQGHQDFVYSMACHGNFVATGGGNGILVMHDIRSGDGRPLWGIGVCRSGAVRAISILAEKGLLLSAGDDGKALVHELPGRSATRDFVF